MNGSCFSYEVAKCMPFHSALVYLATLDNQSTYFWTDSGTCEFEPMNVLYEMIFHIPFLYVHFILKGKFSKEASTCWWSPESEIWIQGTRNKKQHNLVSELIALEVHGFKDATFINYRVLQDFICCHLHCKPLFWHDKSSTHGGKPRLWLNGLALN